MWLKPKAATLVVLVSAPLLGAIHLFVYSLYVSLYLYQLAGGITHIGGWTQYGGAPFAWTIPLQLPGTLLLSRERLDPSVYTIANVLVLAASITVGYCAASLAASFIWKERRPPLYLDWRVLTIILGIIWIPVPEALAFVYYHTVKY